MPRLVLTFLLLLAALFPGASPAAEDHTLALPFGLKWGTASHEVEAGLQVAGAKIDDRQGTPGGQESWTVSGLQQEGLKQILFVFQGGALAGLELQYQHDSWNYATYDEFMHRVRQSLEERYGPGKQLARRKEQTDQVWQTLVGYRWPVGSNRLELVYFSAQDQKNDFRLVSLHFEAEPKPEPPAPPEKLSKASPPPGEEPSLFANLPPLPKSSKQVGKKSGGPYSEPPLPER